MASFGFEMGLIWVRLGLFCVRKSDVFRFFYCYNFLSSVGLARMYCILQDGFVWPKCMFLTVFHQTQSGQSTRIQKLLRSRILQAVAFCRAATKQARAERAAANAQGSPWNTEMPSGAPTARPHPSLGQRPRKKPKNQMRAEGPTHHRTGWRRTDDADFQPSDGFGSQFLGLCPRLGW